MIIPSREIRLAGTQLLPPSPEPQIPADIGVEETVRVYPPCPPWAPGSAQELVELHKDPHHPKLDRRYWRIHDAYEQHPTYLEAKWTNRPDPGIPATGSGWGLDRVPEVVEFQVKKAVRKSGLPDLWEAFGGFILSPRLLDVLREADGNALAWRPIIMRDRGGELVDDGHFFVDIVQNVWAVDFANSIVDYYGGQFYDGDRTLPRPWSYVSARLRDDLDPEMHVFRQAIDPRLGRNGRGQFISDAVRTRIESLVPKVRNVGFSALYSGF